MSKRTTKRQKGVTLESGAISYEPTDTPTQPQQSPQSPQKRPYNPNTNYARRPNNYHNSNNTNYNTRGKPHYHNNTNSNNTNHHSHHNNTNLNNTNTHSHNNTNNNTNLNNTNNNNNNNTENENKIVDRRGNLTRPERERIKDINRQIRKKHPTTIPTGIVKDFFIDGSQYDITDHTYMKKEEIRSLCLNGIASIDSYFAYKEQYYEIAYRMKHESHPPGSPVSLYSHLHKSLDDCVTSYHLHSHKYPFETSGMLASSTIGVSPYQLSCGNENNFMYKGSFSEFDSALCLEEMYLQSLLFNDIRSLEIVTEDNRAFMDVIVSSLLAEKKEKLLGIVSQQLIMNLVESMKKEKGLILFQKIFVLLPVTTKNSIVTLFIEKLNDIYQLESELLKEEQKIEMNEKTVENVRILNNIQKEKEERKKVIALVSEFIMKINDVFQLVDFINIIESIFVENGVELFGSECCGIIQAILKNENLQEEEPDLYEEFLGSCFDILENYKEEENAKEDVITFFEALREE